jgi:hypothetical protein
MLPVIPQESLALVNTLKNTLFCRGPDKKGLGEGQYTDNNQEDCFGDYNKTKGRKTLRIGFQNIGGFPIDKRKIKEEIIHEGSTKWDFDIFRSVETNIDWRKVPEESKLSLGQKNDGTHFISVGHTTPQ